MIINKIERMKDLGVFREFTWPSGLQGFAQYNLIYGWNGTGKTTISRLFANLAAGETPPEGDVALRIDDTLIRGSEFASADVDALVFNRDFVDNNVFQARQSGMPLIVVTGQENVEKQRHLGALLELLPGIRENERAAETAVHKRGNRLVNSGAKPGVFGRICARPSRLLQQIRTPRLSKSSGRASRYRPRATLARGCRLRCCPGASGCHPYAGRGGIDLQPTRRWYPRDRGVRARSADCDSKALRTLKDVELHGASSCTMIGRRDDVCSVRRRSARLVGSAGGALRRVALQDL